MILIWPNTGTLLLKSLYWCISKEGYGVQARFPQDIWPMLVLHTLQQVTGDKQQDILPFHIPAEAGGLRAVEWWGHRKRIPAPNWTPSHILDEGSRKKGGITVREFLIYHSVCSALRLLFFFLRFNEWSTDSIAQSHNTVIHVIWWKIE